MILHGDCLEHLKRMAPDSIDALVTDPPAGISFMGKAWDGDKGGRKEWIAWMSEVMAECLRVMKPGAHGLVWALPRTSHWTATALEDAGFEVRDCVYHVFGSGFPKSLDVSKAIDKAAGAEREITGTVGRTGGGRTAMNDAPGNGRAKDYLAGEYFSSAPATDDAKRWQGWGTALKPAVECWWLIRKPLSEKTVAKNVQKWGTGALNIHASRIGAADPDLNRKSRANKLIQGASQVMPTTVDSISQTLQGRFPSHLILDEEAGAMLDAQSGTLGNAYRPNRDLETPVRAGNITRQGMKNLAPTYPDSGGASRFFYCAKISAAERNAGLEGMPRVKMQDHAAGTKRKLVAQAECSKNPNLPRENFHPCVKPQKLMRYLCRMVTPPGGLVLDPFTGSGSTGCAAVAEGFRFLGIEREAEYAAIAEKRMEAVFG